MYERYRRKPFRQGERGRGDAFPDEWLAITIGAHSSGSSMKTGGCGNASPFVCEARPIAAPPCPVLRLCCQGEAFPQPPAAAIGLLPLVLVAANNHVSGNASPLQGIANSN